jgi:predicted glycosyltransferase involved in capsule biosynthesis
MQKPLLTIVIHVYNQAEAVKKHVDFWKKLPSHISSRLAFICIDDFSDDPLVISKEHLNLRLFRITDDIDWNMPGCKNLGAVMTKTDWMLFFDIDTFIETDGFDKILSGIEGLNPKALYRFRLQKDGLELDSHINTLLLNRDSFFEAGCLDEDFAGNYGYEDVHFNMIWNKNIGPTIIITNIIFNLLNYPTVKLNRDTKINQALGTRKIYEENFSNSRGKLRFKWIEVDTN